jgi:hypothetical protein
MRPPVADVYDLLVKYNALIVHFSGAPKGAGKPRPDRLYPNDLLHAMTLQKHEGLSCSTVMPGDNFHGLNRNAIGSIGIILGLRSPKSLIGVSPHDCGSFEDANGARQFPHQPSISISDIENSIVNRQPGRYNEWGIEDFNVLGIFASPPFDIAIEIPMSDIPGIPVDPIDSHPIEVISQTTLQEVSRNFFRHKVFGFQGNALCEWRGEQPAICAIRTLYQ